MFLTMDTSALHRAFSYAHPSANNEKLAPPLIDASRVRKAKAMAPLGLAMRSASPRGELVIVARIR